MRALFERTISTYEKSDAFPLWKNFIDYENDYSDLASIHKNEKRFMSIYPNSFSI